MSVTIHNGDCRSVLKSMADESVHCVVTSPPYFGLRDYGVDGQIGLENTPDAFVAEMVGVFSEVRRVLKNDGVLWLNLGDSYNAGRDGGHAGGAKQALLERHKGIQRSGANVPGLKPKDLIGIPWRVAFALQEDGWYLRQDIIWSKPNPMPESVRDRCTKAHEYIFMLTKSARYYFDGDAIAEVSAYPGDNRALRTDTRKLVDPYCADNGSRARTGNPTAETRNKRSVWEVATAPFSEAHFATFPPALIEPCIKAGCPERCCVRCGSPWARETERLETQNRTAKNGEGNGQLNKSGRFGDPQRIVGGLVPTCECPFDYTTARGVVLDPFGGAGTTGLVADRLQRNAILIELNPEYAAMARRRIEADAGLFGEVAA